MIRRIMSGGRNSPVSTPAKKPARFEGYFTPEGAKGLYAICPPRNVFRVTVFPAHFSGTAPEFFTQEAAAKAPGGITTG
jgi:hypothetical protein